VNTKKSFSIRLVLYVVLIVLVNLAGMNLFFRADLTGSGAYSLSEASRRAVSSLSEPLTIKAFFSKDLPAPYNGTARYLRDLLEEYGIYGNRYFNYQFHEVGPEGAPGKAGENEEIAMNYGIPPIQIQHIEKDEVKFKKVFMGIVILHGNLIEKIPSVTSSDGLEYRITTAILKLHGKIGALLGLEGKVAVKLFQSSSLNAVAPYIDVKELPELPARMDKLVEDLNGKNYGKLAFTAVDPDKGEAEKAEAQKYGLMRLRWPDLEKGDVKAGEGVIGLVMEYGGKTVEIPVLNVIRIPILGTSYRLAGLDQIREQIEGNLDGLIGIYENVGYLADHGTLPIYEIPGMEDSGDSASGFHSLLSKSYTVRDVRMKDGTLLDNFNSLIIAGPKEKFTDYELFQLDQLLMKGKNLALFLDAYREEQPPANQPNRYNAGGVLSPLDTGLEKLVAHYGASMGRAFVLDESCFRQRMPARSGGGERALYFAPIIKSGNIRRDAPFMKNIRGLVVMRVSPLELREDRIREEGVKATELFTSSDRSWTLKDVPNLSALLMQVPPPEKEMAKSPLAVLLEGSFPSYFKGKPIPERQAEAKEGGDGGPAAATAPPVEQEGGVIEQGKPGKIFLIGTSDVLMNQMVDEQGDSPNSVFLLNVIDHLNNRDDIAVMRGKAQELNPLADMDPWAKTAVKVFNIAGLPILVVLFGLAVWARRISRKKAIRNLFSPAGGTP
jgi:ABC-type uncharacterized transport system involved in gliding motility auxiliary subunit